MFNIAAKIHALLTKEERRRFIFLVLFMIVMGLIDVAGIASIMPFMAVVANPKVIETNVYLSWAYHGFGFTSTTRFLISLGFVVFFTLLASNAMKAFVLYFELNFVHLRLYSLSRRLLESYLNQPYVYFLGQNTAVLSKNILQEVSKFCHEVLRPCTQIFSRAVAATFIICLLLAVDPVLALTIVSVLGGAYSVIYVIIQRKLARIGAERFRANEERSKIASEAFGGIKDVKMLHCDGFFLDRFSLQALKAETKMVGYGLMSQLPSYIMEVTAFGGILIIVLYFLFVRDFESTLPVIALYAFAGVRLMPALQGIFSALTILRFNLPIVDSLHRDLTATPVVPIGPKGAISAMKFEKAITLSSIVFSYPGAGMPVIKGLDLTIEKNASIGLVGGTGSGKTTLVDVILGLLLPASGSLLVDGVAVTPDNVEKWHRNLGYVPQHIYLCDDTVAANIAFGVPPDKIAVDAVQRAAMIANLHDFVVNELPLGYETVVGERGVRLSGGQRQRIGIARALYQDPEVLIMDEATSALDGATENAVMQGLHNLLGKKTIVTIAHRFTTLKECDVIYVIDKGRIVEQGTYAQLSSFSQRFQAMARSVKN
ncbi:ABC transporter ATP-binding protein [Geomonas agri]|uniref:ABC transporter ATP-binding protein n=1 Tax=Geomonas agri TaxID=2873702 RepID=UPI001CD5E17E|nr:ABC transporter ATP-binding protein [Geomonas agri]